MTTDQRQPPLSEFERQREAFRKHFVVISGALIALAATIRAVSGLILANDVGMALYSLVAIGLAALCIWLALKKSTLNAARVLVYGSLTILCGSGIAAQSTDPFGAFAMTFLITIAAFLISPRAVIIPTIASALTLVLTRVTVIREGTFGGGDINFLTFGILFLTLMAVVLYLFARQANKYLDLHRDRLAHNDELFQQVPAAANQLGSAAKEILAMGEQQQGGVSAQASAVDETRQSLHLLLQSFETIIESSQSVFESAETTLNNAERVAEHLTKLSEHTARISDILDSIKALARKSDLLALNAALEGTKAGAAGHGFSLVAGRMQVLAESTAAAAEDVRRFTEDIRSESTATQQATKETTTLAKTTTEAAEKIRQIVQQQHLVVGDLTKAADDIATISHTVAAGTQQTISSTEELTTLADRLLQMVEEFRAAAS